MQAGRIKLKQRVRNDGPYGPFLLLEPLIEYFWHAYIINHNPDRVFLEKAHIPFLNLNISQGNHFQMFPN